VNGAVIEPECLEDSDGSSRLPTFAGHEKRPGACRAFQNGAAYQNRTDDLFITSESLYRLS